MLEFVPTDVQPADPHDPDPLGDEYHVYVYGPVPPVGFAVSVTVCPVSMLGELGDTDPDESAEFTVTAALVAGVAVGCGVTVVPVSVSVTVSTQVVVVPLGVYVSEMAPELTNPGQVPDATAHRYVNVPVPPNGVAVIVTDWPKSIVTEVGEIDTVGAG